MPIAKPVVVEHYSTFAKFKLLFLARYEAIELADCRQSVIV